MSTEDHTSGDQSHQPQPRAREAVQARAVELFVERAVREEAMLPLSDPSLQAQQSADSYREAHRAWGDYVLEHYEDLKGMGWTEADQHYAAFSPEGLARAEDEWRAEQEQIQAIDDALSVSHPNDIVDVNGRPEFIWGVAGNTARGLQFIREENAAYEADRAQPDPHAVAGHTADDADIDGDVDDAADGS